jgi:hypothetical protein
MKIALNEIVSVAAPYWVPEDLPRLLGKLNLRRATLLTIGKSRENRPLYGLRIGRGTKHVSLIAGAHADEPVGPVTLLQLCRWLTASKHAEEMLEAFTFYVCPHVNPDGAHRNSSWTSRTGLTIDEYLKGSMREEPGDDMEFGFPSEHGHALRPENRAVADFLRPWGPYVFHASLHGMAIAEGAWFLINRENVEATAALRRDLASAAAALDLPLHDWDRHGEKGFTRIEVGFSTTPTGAAMREHFTRLNETAMAALFLLSSMEFVAALGGAPLCMVSEVPLFLVTHSGPDAKMPGQNFIEAKERLLAANLQRASGNLVPLDALKKRFGFEPLPLAVAMQLQLAMVFLGIGAAKLDELAVHKPEAP